MATKITTFGYNLGYFGRSDEQFSIEDRQTGKRSSYDADLKQQQERVRLKSEFDLAYGRCFREKKDQEACHATATRTMSDAELKLLGYTRGKDKSINAVKTEDQQLTAEAMIKYKDELRRCQLYTEDKDSCISTAFFKLSNNYQDKLFDALSIQEQKFILDTQSKLLDKKVDQDLAKLGEYGELALTFTVKDLKPDAMPNLLGHQAGYIVYAQIREFGKAGGTHLEKFKDSLSKMGYEVNLTTDYHNNISYLWPGFVPITVHIRKRSNDPNNPGSNKRDIKLAVASVALDPKVQISTIIDSIQATGSEVKTMAGETAKDFTKWLEPDIKPYCIFPGWPSYLCSKWFPWVLLGGTTIVIGGVMYFTLPIIFGIGKNIAKEKIRQKTYELVNKADNYLGPTQPLPNYYQLPNQTPVPIRAPTQTSAVNGIRKNRRR